MATLLLNRGRENVVETDIKHHIFVKFILFDKIDMKYEITVSELTPPPNISLIPLKIKTWSKVVLWPGKQRMT